MNKAILLFLIFAIFCKIITTKKKIKKNLLFSANLEKLVPTLTVTNNNINNKNKAKYIEKPFLKNTNNGDNFYTITTHTNFKNYGKGVDHKESLMTVFTDKPYREVKKISLTEGLLKIFKDSHLNKIVTDDHPNGIINLITNNGQINSFPVTFTGCSPASSNSLIGWVRGHTDKKPIHLDHHKHLNNADKERVSEIHDILKNNHNSMSFENRIPKHANKEKLIELYGNNYMDILLRHCLLTMKFMDKKDERIFENLMKKKFNSISNVSVFIDSECPFWTTIACLSTKAAVVVASLPEIGPAEVAAAISIFALKDILEKIVTQFVHNSAVSSIINTIIRCTPLSPMCIVGPIVNYIYGCSC